MLPLILVILILSLSAFCQAKFSGWRPTVEHSQGKHAARVDSHKA